MGSCIDLVVFYLISFPLRDCVAIGDLAIVVILSEAKNLIIWAWLI
jgi:hypothetical protein